MDKLAEVARQVGGAAWVVLVKAAEVDGWIGLALAVVFLVASGLGAGLMLWAGKKANIADRVNASDSFANLAVVAGIAAVAAFVCALIVGGQSIDNVIYPEGVALSQVMAMVQGAN